MFGTKSSERKLRVNLGLVVTRLKLQEKKKTGLALRARPEIAEYVRIAKTDRARVRVESIIREDYLVEAMELVEMYADLLQSRLGLLQAGNLHESLRKPVATLIWCAPRLAQYCQELQIVQKLLADLFGKKFVKACEANEMDYVCERVIAKLDPKPPKASLVERYLIEICKTADVDFTPDPKALNSDLFDTPPPSTDFMEFNSNFNGAQPPPGVPPPGGFGGPGAPGGGSGGFGGGGGGGARDPSTFSYAAPAFPPQQPQQPQVSAAFPHQPQAPAFPQQPQAPVFPQQGSDQSTYANEEKPAVGEDKQAPPLPSKSPAGSTPAAENKPVPPPYTTGHPSTQVSQMPVLPDLPSVPPSFRASSTNDQPSNDVDFDDLSRRFENLRKKT